METKTKMAAQSFRDLIVWQQAHQFVRGLYLFTRTFPAKEKFELTSPMRRAAVSVPAKIVERLHISNSKFPIPALKHYVIGAR